MIEKIFRLRESGTTVRTEAVAGLTTFLTMAYIIFLQPAVLSGRLFGSPTGMDFGAVMTATCLSAALATLVMGFWARYPIAQAPGMGENFFFVGVMTSAATLPAVQSGDTTAWQVALGVVFVAGVLFLILSLLRIREHLLDAVSPSLRNAMAVGIGLFITFIGLKEAGLVVGNPGTLVALNPHFSSPDLIVFFAGLFLTAALHVRKVKGSILWGIVGATVLAWMMKEFMPAGLAAPPRRS